MALIATMYQAGEIVATARTGADGVAVFSDQRYAEIVGLITAPGQAHPTRTVHSVDLDRPVTVADGDLFLVALPDHFQTSGQGTSVGLSDDEHSEDELATHDIVRRLRREPVAAGDAHRALPKTPGLYAVWGSPRAWTDLGIEDPAGNLPLYVGKTESSLRDRDGRTHFCVGKTGSSTLRRSLAALLHEQEIVRVEAQPRNPANPGHFADFGLQPHSDYALQTWIETHLTVGAWSWDAGDPLEHLERRVLSWREWQEFPPPLNLKDVGGASSAMVRRIKAARGVLADQARTWAPAVGARSRSEC